ncbi:hypothetical protein EON65_14805, partial [archaeon]
MPLTPPAVSELDSTVAPYKLLPREVQGVHALIDFLNTKCGIIKMDAKKFAHRLLTSQGIYNLS